MFFLVVFQIWVGFCDYIAEHTQRMMTLKGKSEAFSLWSMVLEISVYCELHLLDLYKSLKAGLCLL